MEKTIYTKSSNYENFNHLIKELVREQVESILSKKEQINLSVQTLKDEDEILTIERVAEILQMNPRIVREKVNNGELPAYRVGFSRRIYLLKSEIIGEIKSGRQSKSLSMLMNRVNSDYSNALNS